MINNNDYLSLSKYYKSLLVELNSRLDKDILISVSYYDKSRKEYVLNYVKEEESSRLTIFIGNNGIESFMDLNVNGGKDALISAFELSYLDFELKNKDSITDTDNIYFKYLNKRILKENNLLINYFERGYINPKIKPGVLIDLKEISEVLKTILHDEEENVKFKDNDMFLLYINRKDFVYSFFKTDESMFLPKLNFKRPKCNLEIAQELANFTKTDFNMALSISYTYNFTNKNYPLILIGYGKLNEAFSEALLFDLRKTDLKKVIWSYLMELFEKYGLPKSLTINDMEVLNYVEKTLKSLDISLNYDRHNAFTNSYIEDLELALYAFNEYAVASDKNLDLFNDFLKLSNNFLVAICLDGYNPAEQKIVDNLKELYDVILNYADDPNMLTGDYEDYDNNLVS